MLWPASAVFGVIVFVRRVLYRLRLFRSAWPGIPVIVVGNLIVGGSGKSPTVIALVELLKSKGWLPAIVSRGYGGNSDEPQAVTLASDPAQVGDEPVLLARRSGCPVWVGADRVRACELLRKRHSEVNVLVLDDGLQHYRLRRNLEIAVVDRRGFGNGLLLPAGPLREAPSRLASVDAVIAHGADRSALVRVCADRPVFGMALQGDTIYCLADARQRRNLRELSGSRVHAVAGIGDPRRFFAQLGASGLTVVPHPFPDHHPFRPEDLAFDGDEPIIMTEKDAVKCKLFASARYWVLPVSAALDPKFDEWILRRLDERT